MLTKNWNGCGRKLLAGIALLSLTLAAPSALADKKKKGAEAPKAHAPIDYSNIVWPNPPAIARIKYTTWYAAEKISQVEAGNDTKKAKWMDRLAGTQPETEKKMLFQLGEPYGWRWIRRGMCIPPIRRWAQSLSSILRPAMWS